MNRKTALFLFLAFLLYGLADVCWKYRYFLCATFHECFTKWDFEMPKKGGEFHVKHSASRVMKRIIERAFPEYKVVFGSQSPSPHLILKEYYTPTNFNHAARAPYLGFSGEQEHLRWKRYLPSGYPFIEIVSNYKEGDHFIFIPYIVYGKQNLRELLQTAMKERVSNKVRSQHVAYISSHCIQERDTMFQLLRNRLKEKAVSFGRCCQTPGYQARGTYAQLKHIYKQYNFGIAMENHDRKGYLTEKISNVLEAGSIPLYWGDSDLARSFFNPDVFIDLKNYKNFEEAADAIVELTQNPQEMKKMLTAPLFKNGKIPPLLLLNDDTLTEEEERILQKMAKKLRRSYELYLKQKKEPNPYWIALNMPHTLWEKIR